MNKFEHTSQAAAWTSSSITSADAYTLRLDDDDRRELLAAARAIPPGAGPEGTRKADFALPRLTARLAAAAAEVRDGRGFVVLRGLPCEEGTSLQDFVASTWALGMQFGEPLSQNTDGNLIGHVVDATAVDPTPRMYRSNLELRPHNDITGMITLACWHKSETGGASVIVSAVTVHDALRATRPDLLEVLYNGFYYHQVGEEAEGAEPVTPFRVPLFAVREGQLSSRYLRSNIVAGHRARNIPLTEIEIEALNAFDKLATAPEHRLAFFLERGDMIVMNNYTVMHARTSFTNYPEPERKRHLVRLWLDAPGFRNVPAEYNFHGVNGVPRQEGRRATLNFRKLYSDDPVATGGVADLKVTDEMARALG
jgi:alpha-ketoglutarate-dependent taurine dioxygenase